jgi:octaprenyl-diphosphate synthase
MGNGKLKSRADTGPEIVDFQKLLEPIWADLRRVEVSLADQVHEFEPEISQYVEYILGGVGKRLRPSLALLSSGATGRIGQEHITLGVIVELIHIATLVHDDVLDEAELRHGLPTANARWDNELSVLVGDCLFAHALKLSATYLTTDFCRKVSEAANAVCSGEILQMRRRFDLDLSLDDYIEIIRLKTGALFAVSCELGAFLNAAPTETVKALRDCGSDLGIAYQIYDDCVDIFGKERQAGKSLGTDMKKGKLTLPLLLLLQRTEPARRKEIGDLYFAASPSEQLRLLELFNNQGIVQQSFNEITKYINRAQSNLACLPSNPYTSAFTQLLDYLNIKSRKLLQQEAVA